MPQRCGQSFLFLDAGPRGDRCAVARRVPVSVASELQQRVTTDHYCCRESMINPSAHRLSLEPGELRGELGYAVYGLYVFLNTRDDDFRIQARIAQCPEPGIRCRRENQPDRASHRPVRSERGRRGADLVPSARDSTRRNGTYSGRTLHPPADGRPPGHPARSAHLPCRTAPAPASLGIG